MVKPLKKRMTLAFQINEGSATDAEKRAAHDAAKEFDIFHNNDDDDKDAASVDCFGMPTYKPRYPSVAYNADTDLSIPWNLRRVRRRMQCDFFNFLSIPQFWKQFEFATRVTACAVLIPSAIIAADLTNNPFISPFMVISATVLAAKGSVGEAIAYIFAWTRAGCFWLIPAVIGGLLHLGDHIVGWCVYYTALLFIMALFTEGIVMRICLLLFNSCMVGLLVNTSRDYVYPCRVMVDWCIGTGLCTVAAFFPYPIFCKAEAQRKLTQIAKNTGTAFRGLAYSFWSPSNVERNMALSKVRLMTQSLDDLLPEFEHNQAFAFFEFFFESTEQREIRDIKFTFFERLRINLSSMTRVLDIVEGNPSAVDDSDRASAFGELLTPQLDAVAESFDVLMDQLAHARSRKAILNLRESFDTFNTRVDEMETAYRAARRALFYEHVSFTLEEFVPLMTFYLFTVICFRDTIEMFEVDVKKYKPSTVTTIKKIFMKVAADPFTENLEFLRKLFTLFNRREWQRVLEAVKVSGAMLLTIGFSFLINIDKESFTGPNIIAFVSGSNPVEAVQASIVRLTGCLLGTVLGFFAGIYSETAVQRVASLCTLMFCGTFLRNDKEYGIMSVYGMFVLIPLDSVVETTIADTVARMNQNTFGIFIYLFVSAIIFPLTPSVILRAKRVNVLKVMSDVLQKMADMFSELPTRKSNAAAFAMVNIESSGDDTLASNDERAPATVPGPVRVTNRSMHVAFGKDAPMEALDKQLNNLIKRLKGTKQYMGFAKDERTLIEIDYPVRACQNTYNHMYRMTYLLKTMYFSWNVIRSQPHFLKGSRKMYEALTPIASDIAYSFHRFVALMACMMKDPSVNLEGEVTRAVVDLMEMTQELQTRKSQIMLVLINKSVSKYRNGEEMSPLSLSPGTSFPISRQDSSPHSTTSNPTRGLVRAATYDVIHGDASQNPTTYYSPTLATKENFRVAESHHNVTIGHYFSQEDISRASEPVRLPENFRFPVSSEDAEGMHSFGLCLHMFANETKMLMMSLGAMLDLLRSKI
ncbi:hypothetical protein STCU_07104 [Strigomonas culicis]|uniref:Integral membrane bound transporter domain-containing protein n=1 Tax=Strigomonas culicis TaxID=28005 RepID=S9VN15_9TRYP|nr:hypothetical protein STCU_07104 [Strigomonas culicis]|eukprot:EPY24590.1 hypothetical protein STCU_07104 [Strigomonas culicis]